MDSLASQRCFARGAADDGAPPPPRPEVFALMRNGHEVLRGALKECDEALALPDRRAGTKAFAARYKELKRWQDIHMAMEEGTPDKKVEGVFAMLDRLADNAAAASGLHSAHATLSRLERTLERALFWRRHAHLQSTWAAFRTENEAHYVLEERTMMPEIAKLNQAGTNMRELMVASVLGAVQPAEMPFFVSFATRMLDKYSEGKPRLRVFLHALQAVCDSEAQWIAYRAHVEAGLSDAAYSQLGEELDLAAWGLAAYPPGRGP